ncbi:MAG: hypothetical protein ACI8Z1_001994 [Candidatus Azotimanducaceae bacterium]|jgi:hypothetical protein
MTGQDVSFFYAETPMSPMHFGGIMIDDPLTVAVWKPGVKDILSFIEIRLDITA